jgi:hypothetical protein
LILEALRVRPDSLKEGKPTSYTVQVGSTSVNSWKVGGPKFAINVYYHAGLMEIFAMIPTIQGLRLDEATEHAREPFKATAIFSLKPESASDKYTHSSADTEPGSVARSFPKDSSPGKTSPGGRNSLNLASKRRKGTITPQDSSTSRKYGKTVSVDILTDTIKKFVNKNNSDCLPKNFGKTFANLVVGSLAMKTWKKYASAWRAWEKFLSRGGGELGIYAGKRLGFHLLVQGKREIEGRNCQTIFGCN